MSAFSLRVRFDKPGWFLQDAGLVVSLDGRVLHEGSFLQGFDVTEHVAAGPHLLETAISMGFATRRRRYGFVVDAPYTYRDAAPAYGVRLEYSRLWGNFTKRLTFESA